MPIGREMLERVAAEAEPSLDSRWVDAIESWRARLAGGRFHLALLGEFKRGKSTLANALLGQDILPAAVVPTTSLATFVRSGPRALARIHFNSGGARDVEVGSLSDYVTERKNPNNSLGARFVEVFLPSTFLKDTDLLDTPGIGSAHRQNTEAAMEALGEVDAGIVVLAADQPIGEAELAFLEALRPRVSRFFFAVNRADLLSARELDESLEFIRATLAAHGFAESEFFALSARRALSPEGDEGFARFLRALRRFLREEKEGAWLEAMRGRLAAILAERLFELKLSEESARIGAAERQRRREELRSALGALPGRAESRAAVARARFARLLDAYDDAFRAFAAEAASALDRAIAKTSRDATDLPNRAFDGRLRETVAAGAQETLARFLQGAARRFREGLERIEEEVRRGSDRLAAEAYDAAGRLFNLPAPPRPAAERAPELAAFDLAIPDVRCSLEEATDLVVFHSPRPIAYRTLARRARSSARDLLGRGGGQIRHDLLRKGEEFLARALARADDAEASLAAGLLDAVGEAPEVCSAPGRRAALERIERCLARLEAA